MKNFTRFALTSTAAALLAGATALPVTAAPLGANLQSLKTAAPAATESVQWRGHRHRNAAIGIGAFGLGVVAGTAIANSNRGYYYEEPYGYYDAPYAYGPSYGYSYSAPNGNQPGSWDDPADYAGR